MRRALLALGVAALLSATVAGAATQRAQKDPPTLSPITATFDEGARATYYTITITPPASAGIVGNPTIVWHLSPPPDDPGCAKFLPLPNKASEAVWYHSTDDGCSHKTPFHDGTVSVQVTVTLANDTRPWICRTSYLGTASGTGGAADPCTIEAGATHAVKRPEISSKEKAKIAAEIFDECAEAEGVLAAGAAGATLVTGGTSGVVTVVAGGMGAACVIAARACKIRADDPPESHYTLVAAEHAVAAPRLAPGNGVTPAIAKAFNALSANIASTGGYSQAFATAINRASGANAAGDDQAQTTQEKAAAGDALKIAKLDAARPKLRVALRNAVAAAGVHVTLSAAQVAAAQKSIAANGFPAKARAALARAHVSAGDVAALLDAIAHGTPQAVTLPGDLASPALLKADRQDAASMRAYATS